MECKDSRPSWDETFLDVADVMARRSACFRSKVAAVIVRDGKHVVSTGYNGPPPHQKNCMEIGSCYRIEHGITSGTELERCRASGCHAERNAINIAAKLGISTSGTTMYVIGANFICDECQGSIDVAGITRVVLRDKQGNVFEFIPSRDWTVHPVDRENEP